MATETLSIGDELKDSFKPTNQWVKNGVNWLTEISHFYQERALLELEYSTKLQNLCNESFKKKLKMSTNLSVGDDPVITPGSLESASLVAWGEVLSQSENIAKIHRALSKDLSSKVGDELMKVHSKYEGIRSRYENFNSDVVKQRDSFYDDLSKSKKHYDSLCQSMENQRLKLEKSGGEKGKLKLKSKETDMNIGKNDYLIKINVANRLKDKYYYQDLPEILDGLQDLNESRVERLNRIWLSASAIEKKHLENVLMLLAASDEVVKQNTNTLDTAMFIKHNIRQWTEPPDFHYIPSSIWHDDDTIITTDLELYDLKKKLNSSIPIYEKYEDVCNNQKTALAEIQQQKSGLKSKTLTREELFQFDELLTKYLSELIQYTNNDNKRVISEVEIETIQTAADGKDLALDAPVETKKKSRLNFLKPIKKSYQHVVEDVLPVSASSGTTNLVHHTSSSGGRLFGSLRDRAQSVASSNMSSSTPLLLLSPVSLALNTAKVAYLYDALGDDEVSIQVGESLSVVEPDDGSGWTEVVNSSGEQGLVPSAYIEIIQTQPQQLQKKQGPKVAPRKGAKKIKYCEVMYDYSKTGDDELDLQVGEKVVVVTDDDGSGWTEGEINGNRGLFPTAYVQFI